VREDARRKGNAIEDGEEIIYTYGEGDSEADRLALVAELFEGSSGSFLSEAVGFRPRLALDLGCGVGHTTRLLAEVLRPDRVVGVERSANFLSKARGAAPEEVSFVRHDVTLAPLPHGGEADLIYARLLLSHLPDPEEVALEWLAQLAPGGLLLLDEVERIETEQPVFREYLGILARMMAHHGQELYVGPRLEAATKGPERRLSRIAPASPTTAHVARMFAINLANWRGNDFVRANHTNRELDRLATGLSRLTASQDAAEIRWGMRQIVIEKAPSA
jgi:trans-aconitate 2-methyltransferase